MIFVSGPYSHPDVNVKNERAKTIAQACLTLMQRGEVTISPLTFGLSIIEKTGQDLPDDYAYWSKLCEEFVSVSKQLYILNIDGWNLSSGVLGEIQKALDFNLPVYLVEPHTLEIIKRLDVAEYSELDFEEDMMVKTSAVINFIINSKDITGNEYADLIAKTLKYNLKTPLYNSVVFDTRDSFDIVNNFVTTQFLNAVLIEKTFTKVQVHDGSDAEEELVAAIEINNRIVLLLNSEERGTQIRIQDDNYTIKYTEVVEIFRHLCLIYNKYSQKHLHF